MRRVRPWLVSVFAAAALACEAAQLGWPRYTLQDLALSSDGASVTFRECEHTWQLNPPERQNARGTRVPRVDGWCSDPKTVRLAGVPAASLLAPGRLRWSTV